MNRDRPVVFIVGAGGSQPYGFPTGIDLASQISQRSSDLALRLVQFQCHRSENGVKWAGDEKEAEAIIKAGLEKFDRSGLGSIDEYLGTKSGSHYANALALAVAHVIIEREMAFASTLRRTTDWHRELALPLLPILTDEGAEVKQVKIITFNYDRTLELNLTNMLYGFSGFGWKESLQLAQRLRVAHIHGSVQLPLEQLLPPHHTVEHLGTQVLTATARSIRLVDQHTARSHNECCTNTKACAKEWLSEAIAVAFIGFGFHRPNLEALGIHSGGDWAPKDAKIYFSAMSDWESHIREWTTKVGRDMETGRGDKRSVTATTQALRAGGVL